MARIGGNPDIARYSALGQHGRTLAIRKWPQWKRTLLGLRLNSVRWDSDGEFLKLPIATQERYAKALYSAAMRHVKGNLPI